MLVAETISVILLKDIDLRNPAATPIAILLSMALLANLRYRLQHRGNDCRQLHPEAELSRNPRGQGPSCPLAGISNIPTGGVP